jgi:hypothetical protein
MPKLLAKCAGLAFSGSPRSTKPALATTMSTAPFQSFDLIKPIEIFEIGDVSLHGGDIAADFGFCLVEFPLPAADDGEVGAVFDEFLGAARPMPLEPPVTPAIFP